MTMIDYYQFITTCTLLGYGRIANGIPFFVSLNSALVGIQSWPVIWKTVNQVMLNISHITLLSAHFRTGHKRHIIQWVQYGIFSYAQHQSWRGGGRRDY